MVDVDVTPRKTLSAGSWVAIILAVVGAINWGLIGLFNFNLVAAIFGELSPVSRIVYIVVAVAGLYLLFAATRFRDTGARGPTAA